MQREYIIATHVPVHKVKAVIREYFSLGCAQAVHVKKDPETVSYLPMDVYYSSRRR